MEKTLHLIGNVAILILFLPRTIYVYNSLIPMMQFYVCMPVKCCPWDIELEGRQMGIFLPVLVH